MSQHRKHRRPPGQPEPEQPADSVHAEPAFGDMTIDEIRWFLDEVEKATGPGLSGRLRPRAAVRLSGRIKGIWVKIPR